MTINAKVYLIAKNVGSVQTKHLIRLHEHAYQIFLAFLRREELRLVALSTLMNPYNRVIMRMEPGFLS